MRAPCAPASRRRACRSSSSAAEGSGHELGRAAAARALLGLGHRRRSRRAPAPCSPPRPARPTSRRRSADLRAFAQDAARVAGRRPLRGAPRPGRRRSRRPRAGSGRCRRSGHGRSSGRSARAPMPTQEHDERRHPHPLHERDAGATAERVAVVDQQVRRAEHRDGRDERCEHGRPPALAVLRRRGEVPDDRERRRAP